MKKSKSQKLQDLPDVHVAITYSTVYDDYLTVDPASIIKDIPTIAMLHFVIQLQNKVLYALSDTITQRQMVHTLAGALTNKEERKKVWCFIREQKFPFLISCDTTLLFFRLALSNYVPLEDGDDIELYADEEAAVYKALLYCNQIWTDKPLENNNIEEMMKHYPMGLTKLSVRMDLPIVEFKLYKDFRTQLYKAFKFFEFCESDPVYSTYLPYFYRDHNVKHWKEYLLMLFNFFSSSLSSQYISVDKNHKNVLTFFDQFLVNVNDPALSNIWKNGNGLNYLRDHFLIPIVEGTYLLLNANLLVDKIYQGMKFDFFKTLKSNNLQNSKGKKFSNYPDFNSELGQVYSEPKLLYPILNKIYQGKADKTFEGESLKAIFGDSEPDYYLRVGNALYLFEHKDLTLGDLIKKSNNTDEIIQQILERICYDGTDSKGNYKRKGGGQLLNTINEIVNNHVLDADDSGVANVKYIYPIIVTTDTAFSALGVNGLCVYEVNNIIQKKGYKFGECFVSIPIVVDIDTIIKMAYDLHVGRLDLGQELNRYLVSNAYNMAPFNTFMIDKRFRGKPATKEELSFLFEGMIPDDEE
jgi:hypothetical protein